MKLKLALCLFVSVSVQAALKPTLVTFAAKQYKIQKYPFKSSSSIAGNNWGDPTWGFEHCEVIDTVTGKNYSDEGFMIVRFDSGWMGFEKKENFALLSILGKTFASQEEKHQFFEKQFKQGYSWSQDFDEMLKRLFEHFDKAKKDQKDDCCIVS